MLSTPPTAASSSALAWALRDHFSGVILPMWRGPGFNAALQLPFEALDVNHRPVRPQRYRAMACARQLFVFSQAGDAVHAHVLFDSLTSTFRDIYRGGWFYSVDAQGVPLDTTKDLYTHAFVVFACAEYARRCGSPDALEIVYGTSELIQAKFAAADDLLNAALTADFAKVTGLPAQNPLMHLTEAWLAAREATHDRAFDAQLRRLAGAVSRHFVHPKSGCIAEFPLGMQGNRLEPGHQFEWFWLVNQAGPLFEGTGLAETVSRAFSFAQRNGVNERTGGVCASLDEERRIQDPNQRIWAQTEYLRALAIHEEPTVRATLPRQMELFRQRFLRVQGWIECRAATGEIARVDMPSTTPYHLATAFNALPA
ncbi:mannose-6-phosphate isomerase [Paraburkholderia graminis]|uniref:AGE family epimerase/isomerase n=1 Tax=Paraburkholderia graminis TaxID=60548 RepID=UPI0028648D06|nr:AGE family epimerase/isomerase [Paraburkholderia graminis]MDR6477304.1 mannose-6-phosphate isomerase [Paraburkholderia graminis]